MKGVKEEVEEAMKGLKETLDFPNSFSISIVRHGNAVPARIEAALKNTIVEANVLLLVLLLVLFLLLKFSLLEIAGRNKRVVAGMKLTLLHNVCNGIKFSLLEIAGRNKCVVAGMNLHNDCNDK